MPIKKGKESPYFKNRVGEIWMSNEGYEMTITASTGVRNCTIQLNDERKTVLYNLEYNNIKKGQIKNPYHRSNFGVGYTGEGRHATKVNGKTTRCCETWRGIIKRCYSIKSLEKHPTYKGIKVCEQWECFQNFGDWFEENWKPWMDSSWEIDKDIIVKGNKVYSPETCEFVPSEINSVILTNKNTRGSLPIGVSQAGKKFIALCNINRKIKNLKLHVTPEEAFQAYKIAKEARVKELANKWRGKISARCYWTLMSYKVEITD